MNWLNTILILAAAFLAVFGEAAFPLLRHWLGAQVDLLPGLMVYTALNADLVTVSLLAALGGLWFDALSANPLGRQHPAALCHWICDLFATRTDFARAALRAIHPRRGGQRRGAGLVCPVAAHGRPGTVAGLGFALAMAGHDGRRRGRDADSV